MFFNFKEKIPNSRNKKSITILCRAVMISRFIGILRYKSEKVQYIGTKNVSPYTVVTINGNTRK